MDSKKLFRMVLPAILASCLLLLSGCAQTPRSRLVAAMSTYSTVVKGTNSWKCDLFEVIFLGRVLL